MAAFSLAQAKQKLPGWSLFLLTLVVGVAAGHYVPFTGSIGNEAACDSRLPLLNPYLRCEPAEELRKKEFTAFRATLEAYIGTLISQGKASSIAVYYRDLENGPWFGIEEDALFSPASLLKLPVLIAYYKRSESEPDLLTREIMINGERDAGQELPAEQIMQRGAAYTIDELLRRMIVYSDNESLHILLAYLAESSPEDDIFAETLAAMGVASSEASEQDFLTVKRYSAFYRALYNASFLSKEMSQKALGLLTQTTFSEGIDDGVPEGIAVAHKFGIRKEESAVQLHDCGIIYHPESPYLLCIMTRGPSQEMDTQAIRDISRMTYDEVDRRSRGDDD